MVKFVIFAVALLALAAGQAVAAKKGKDGSTYTEGWVHVNSTGIVDISSIKTKNITLTTFISVESYSKYANVSMLSSTAFQVTRTAMPAAQCAGGVLRHEHQCMKSSVLVGYSANNTSNGTTKGALMVVFPKANWKGAAAAATPEMYAKSTMYKATVPSFNGTATVSVEAVNNGTMSSKWYSKKNITTTPVYEFTEVELTGKKYAKSVSVVFDPKINPTAFAIVVKRPFKGKLPKTAYYFIEFEGVDSNLTAIEGYIAVKTVAA